MRQGDGIEVNFCPTPKRKGRVLGLDTGKRETRQRAEMSGLLQSIYGANHPMMPLLDESGKKVTVVPNGPEEESHANTNTCINDLITNSEWALKGTSTNVEMR